MSSTFAYSDLDATFGVVGVAEGNDEGPLNEIDLTADLPGTFAAFSSAATATGAPTKGGERSFQAPSTPPPSMRECGWRDSGALRGGRSKVTAEGAVLNWPGSRPSSSTSTSGPTTCHRRRIALFSLAYFGQQSWSTLVMILPTDIFPKSTVGAVAGLVGFGGAMGGVVFGQLVGYLLDHGYGYGLVFALAGSLHVVAFATICLAIPGSSRLHERVRIGVIGTGGRARGLMQGAAGPGDGRCLGRLRAPNAGLVSQPSVTSGRRPNPGLCLPGGTDARRRADVEGPARVETILG